jgi:hypothetical protein
MFRYAGANREATVAPEVPGPGSEGKVTGQEAGTASTARDVESSQSTQCDVPLCLISQSTQCDVPLSSLRYVHCTQCDVPLSSLRYVHGVLD